MAVGPARFLGMGASRSDHLPTLFFRVGGWSACTGFVRQALQPQGIEPSDPTINRGQGSILLLPDRWDLLTGLSQPDGFRSFYFNGRCGLRFDQFFECFTLLFGQRPQFDFLGHISSDRYYNHM